MEVTLAVPPIVGCHSLDDLSGDGGEGGCAEDKKEGRKVRRSDDVGGGVDDEEEDNEYDDSASDLDVELFDEWLEEELNDVSDDELFNELSSDDEPPLHHQLLLMSLKETSVQDETSNFKHKQELRKTIGTTGGEVSTDDHESVGRRRSERVRSIRGNTTSKPNTQPLSSPPPFRTSKSDSTLAGLITVDEQPRFCLYDCHTYLRRTVEELKERMGSAALGKMRERTASKSYKFVFRNRNIHNTLLTAVSWSLLANTSIVIEVKCLGGKQHRSWA